MAINKACKAGLSQVRQLRQKRKSPPRRGILNSLLGAFPPSMATAGERNRAVEDKNEPARPLALPSPSVHPTTNYEEEAAQTAEGWRSMQYLRKRRCALCCGGCCVTTVAIIGITILVLALTVFKVKDPKLNINSVTLTAVNTGAGTAITDPVALNLTLTADISIKNPNVASFKFSQSDTDFYYKGETVGVAHAPDGEVGADRTIDMNVTLVILTNRLAKSFNISDLVSGKEYNLTSYTEISGRVDVLGIYKRNLDIKMNCSMTLEIEGMSSVLTLGGASSVESKGTNCVANVS